MGIITLDCYVLQHQKHPVLGCADLIPGFISLEHFIFHKD